MQDDDNHHFIAKARGEKKNRSSQQALCEKVIGPLNLITGVDQSLVSNQACMWTQTLNLVFLKKLFSDVFE